MLVMREISLAFSRVVETKHRMETDRSPKRDFSKEQMRDLRIDPAYLMLKVLHPTLSDGKAFTLTTPFEREPAPRERGVGNQVDDEEDPDWYDPTQRMEPADEEVVPLDKTLG